MHAVAIDAADGPALQRVRRMFLGWSAYEDIGDYESFGWWDLQGDATHSDAVDAAADFEPFDDALDPALEDWSEFVAEDCSQAFDDVAF